MAHRRSKVTWVVVAVLVTQLGCAGERSASIYVASETLSQSRKRDFDYHTVLTQAERGDENALADLMRFTVETDAAGALGHGVVLVELLQKLGDDAFSRVADRRSACVRQSVAECLRAGEDYVRPPLAQPIREVFPRTFAALAVAPQEKQHAAEPTMIWYSDNDPTPPYREDGEGPFPQAWPAAALIMPMEPIQEDGLTAATLFLLVAEDLTEANAPRRIPTATRFARQCSLPARGYWVSLSDRSRPVFILVYSSGGTAGLKVEVFARSVFFGWHQAETDTAQNHVFWCELDVHSRLPPYLADTDQDGSLELLVASELTNSSGADDTPQIYDVWAWRDRAFTQLGEMPADDVEEMADRRPL